MCGICCFIGHTDAYEYILSGLNMLQNRGYDSCGICTLNNGVFNIQKFASTDITPSINMISSYEEYFKDSKIGIGHTRWATHGPRTDINSHPHIDYTESFAVVHNGIIENYGSIKKELIDKGIKFKSQTDTEVIVNIISYYYQQVGDTERAIKQALNRLEGTWGLVILSKYEPNKLYCARHGSPLLVGFSTDNDYAMIVSEQCGFSKYINNYIILNDTDIIIVEKNNDKIYFDKLDGYNLKSINYIENNETPYPYPYWTLKEINEQYDAILRAMGMGSRINDDNSVRLGGLMRQKDKLLNCENLILLGCGTSYHSGLNVSQVFKKISGFSNVSVFDGGDFTNNDIPKNGKTCVIFISQSGETKDLHRCIKIVENFNVTTIGVVNVVDSLISREVDCGVYLNAGREVAVASTKSFTSQVVILNMIAIWFAQNRNINDKQRNVIINDLRRLPIDIKNILEDNIETSKNIANKLIGNEHMYILGKGIYESISKESALKLKEIGYIHAEGYNSSSLKHGTYSIIYPNTPIILLTPNDDYFTRNQGIAEELNSRYAYLIGISDIDLDSKYSIRIKINTNTSFNGLLMIIIMQLVSYHLAILKGHNPDTPRNLAKVVTVD